MESKRLRKIKAFNQHQLNRLSSVCYFDVAVQLGEITVTVHLLHVRSSEQQQPNPALRCGFNRFGGQNCNPQHGVEGGEDEEQES